MRKNQYPTEVLDVEVTHLNHKGYGVARYVHAPDRGSNGRGLNLLIFNTVPGDKVRVTVENAKGRRKAHVYYDELLEPSPKRNLAVENSVANSGGTPLLFMKYEDQLPFKENLIKKEFKKQGLDLADKMLPIIGMDEPWRYRNKMELTFGKDGALGMHEIGNYKKVIDLEDSYIAPEILVAIKKVVSTWQQDHHLSSYDKDARQGLLKNLMMRYSHASQEVMVVLVANGRLADYQPVAQDLVDRLSQAFPTIQSMIWLEKPTMYGQAQEEWPRLIYGRDFINESLNGYHYKLKYNTFFQASSRQAERMVACAIDLAEVNDQMRVVDLFCGIGTFSLPFAAKVKELIGIEIVEASIQSARGNAEEAGLTNTSFRVGDAYESLEQLKAEWPTCDLLLLNPPRGGGGRKLVKSIARFGAERMVYISCNPVTLAEDLKWFAEQGYQVQTIQPIDQFPHTLHVECVVLMQKVKE